MALTAAERAKRYREKIREKSDKYMEYKYNDRLRKLKRRATMSKKEIERFLEQHRNAQQRNRAKFSQKRDDQALDVQFYRTKQTLAKAVKKIVRALPENPKRRQRFLQRIAENFGMVPKKKNERTIVRLPEASIGKRER